MTVLEAAIQVLEQAGKPLNYREITRLILKRKLWMTSGKTPEATVNAQLAVDIKKKGKASAFKRFDKGCYALNTERTYPDSCRGDMVRTEDCGLYLAGTDKGKKLSFTEAAVRVLEARYGKPMHYREITRHAIDHDLINTSGKTPEATMYAQIISEIKRRKGRGEQQRFMMLGKGMIALTRWQSKGLVFQVEEANRKTRQKLLSAIRKMTPTDFEELVGRLLAAIGFDEVEVTSRSNDGGIDVRGTLVTGDVIRTRLAVQVKRWKQNVRAPVVQQVRGSLGAHEQGLIISTSDFSKGARKEAERPDATPVGLMNGEQLVALLVEHEIGSQKRDLSLIELGEGSLIEG